MTLRAIVKGSSETYKKIPRVRQLSTVDFGAPSARAARRYETLSAIVEQIHE